MIKEPLSLWRVMYCVNNNHHTGRGPAALLLSSQGTSIIKYLLDQVYDRLNAFYPRAPPTNDHALSLPLISVCFSDSEMAWGGNCAAMRTLRVSFSLSQSGALF